jgi:hypothetical protein
MSEQSRMARERKTVEAMIGLYCQAQHGQYDRSGRLCDECQALRDYARQRLEKCPFQAAKTTCAKCPIHCYKPERRAQIRTVMRYAGPRMLLRHPILALQHMLDGLRPEPIHPGRAGKGRAAAAKRAKT